MQKLVILVAVIATVLSTGNSQEISDQCLGCICQASTGCNKNQGCSQDVCGPFLITWGFWSDAGKLVIRGTSPDSPNAYSDCTNDFFCASETVRAYSRRYAKDCNNDGVIGCEDFAMIHKGGPGGCQNQGLLQSDYYRKFEECKAQVNPQ